MAKGKKNKSYTQLEVKNKILEKELKATKKETISKAWFIKFEELKSNSKNYSNQIVILLTVFLTIITFKPDPNIFDQFPRLRWIITSILILFVIFNWLQNCWENKIAKHFKKKEVNYFWWRYGSTIFTSIALILVIIWIMIDQDWILYWLLLPFVGYLVIQFIPFSKNGNQTNR